MKTRRKLFKKKKRERKVENRWKWQIELFAAVLQKQLEHTKNYLDPDRNYLSCSCGSVDLTNCNVQIKTAAGAKRRTTQIT